MRKTIIHEDLQKEIVGNDATVKTPKPTTPPPATDPDFSKKKKEVPDIVKNAIPWEEAKKELLRERTLFEKIKVLPYRIYYKIEDARYYLKYFYQRGKRGYSDRDVWNMSFFIAETISKMAKQLRKNHYGLPNMNNASLRKRIPAVYKNYIKKDENGFYYMENEGWEAVLKKISESFNEYVKSDDKYDKIKDRKKVTEYYNEVQNKVREACNLMGIFFDNLWD